MRKIDPNDVRSEFADEINDLVGYFDRIAGSVGGSSHEQGDVSRLAETSFLTAFVAFERFLSDLFLAYLNRQFSAYRTDLETRVRQSVQKRFGAWTSAQVNLAKVTHVRVEELEGIVDPDGRNLTFSSAQDIKSKSQCWLAPPYNGRIASLTAHDERLIDTARSIRNFIAHRSKGAKDEMNGYLATVSQGAHNQHLGRGTHEVQAVGSFLKAFFAGQRRVVIYANRLKAISGVM